MESCEICLSISRPIKYVTSRTRICQWCVTVVSKIDTTYLTAKSEIETYAEQYLKPPPTAPIVSSIVEQVASEMAAEDSVIQKWVSILLPWKRRAEVRKLASSLYEVEYQSFLSERLHYDSAKNDKIRAIYREILDDEFSTFQGLKEVRVGGVGVGYERTYENPLKREMLDMVKYLRAYEKKLVSGGEKLDRLPEEEMSEIRAVVKRQDRYSCSICKKKGGSVILHVHHIIPLDAKGTNELENLATLCYSCHNKQHPGFKVTKHGNY